MANIQWYYSRGNGDTQGPVSPAELARLAQAGELRPGDLVWKEGMEEWIAGGSYQGAGVSVRVPGSAYARASRADCVRTSGSDSIRTPGG